MIFNNSLITRETKLSVANIYVFPKGEFGIGTWTVSDAECQKYCRAVFDVYRQVAQAPRTSPKAGVGVRTDQQVAQELLTAAGFEVDVAENGEVAVSRVSEQTYEAVLMDMHMPVMDGETATKKIRSDRRYSELPIIAMTANAMEGDRERCLEVGMNDHVPKPIEPNVLFETLKRWILKERPQGVNPS